MRTYIFNDEERRKLEAYLIDQEKNGKAVSGIIQQIKKSSRLFEDIYLFLQTKRTIPDEFGD